MGKLLTYTVSVVFFGLVQLWSLAIILYFKEIGYTFFDLIKDGGLFFFASSLIVTTFINHFRFRKVMNDTEYSWAIFSIIFILFFCYTGYTTAFDTNFENQSFKINLNNKHQIFQIGCAIYALIYSFIFELRKPLFEKLVDK